MNLSNTSANTESITLCYQYQKSQITCTYRDYTDNTKSYLEKKNNKTRPSDVESPIIIQYK